MTDAGSPYDLVVVGLGAVGSSALFQASKTGARVLGIDRYDPPHDFGSTNAETRITRLAVGEGPRYLPFVARSHQIWAELAAETGDKLYHQSGGCIITPDTPAAGDRWNDFARISASIAADSGIDFELLDAATTRSRYPQIQTTDDQIVGFEPTGGVVMAERAVDTHLRLARGNGAEIRTHQTVTNISVTNDLTTIRLQDGTNVVAEAVVVAAGPWFADLAPPLDREHTYVTRQTVYWFRPEDPEMFRPECFPFIIWVGETPDDYFSSFPMPHGGIPGMKVLTEQFVDRCDPRTVDRTVPVSEINDFYHDIARHRIDGLTSECVKAVACLYTMTTDEHFLIDAHPSSDRVLYASPCSGHGFKHSAAIGEAMAQKMLHGTSTLDIEVFDRTRLVAT